MASPNDYFPRSESGAEMRRRHRSEDEKNRCNYITEEYMYKQLLMSIPHLRQEEEEAQKRAKKPTALKIPRSEILRESINYINYLKRRNAAHQKAVDEDFTMMS